MDQVLVTQDALDIPVLTAPLSHPDAGATVTFSGAVRTEGGRLTGLFLESYPQMAEKALFEIVRQARQRWHLAGVVVAHRYGELAAGDTIVFVGVSARHRQEAFQAAEFLMDYLKTDAPFWKKERSPDGDAWVEARESDASARARWQPED